MTNNSQVINVAQKEAKRLGHNFVGTAHILLGILGDGPGIASTMLMSCGVTPEVVRAELEKWQPREWTPLKGEIPYTPRVKRVMENSWQQAQAFRDNKITNEYLLLGIFFEDEGEAATIFKDVGVDTQALREKLIGVLRPFKRFRK